MGNPNPSNQFRKGDRRASEAGKKSTGGGSKAISPERADALAMLKRFHDRTEKAFEALDALLADTTSASSRHAAAREVFNRTLPESLSEKLLDQELAENIDQLREENAELKRRLAILDPPAKSA
ncbi:MAG: hypothetical protein ABJX32_16640 [Tateyamaria sp.]|uniref:hypothetical protein n=1 Tax=Tateyamaria sp. TaxID=1929288 RepID=UPI00329F6035